MHGAAQNGRKRGLPTPSHLFNIRSFHIWSPHIRGRGSRNEANLSKTIQILRTKMGEGVQKSQNCVDVTYGSPLSVRVSDVFRGGHWAAASCGRSPWGWEALSCVFYCSIAETRHPSMVRFSKENECCKSCQCCGKNILFKKPPLFQQRPFEPDKITYPRNWRRRNIHHLLLLLLLLLFSTVQSKISSCIHLILHGCS